MQNGTEEIPYIIDAPSSHEDFLKLILPYNLDQKRVIIERILVSNHKSLRPENRDKLERFIQVLLDHFEYVCSQEKLDIGEVDLLSKSIYGLSLEYPEASQSYFLSALEDLHEKMHRTGSSFKL